MAKRGSLCETRCDVWHQRYREQGVATVVRCHPKVGVDRQGKVFFSGVGPPDYMGAYLVDGVWRNICFEAKETAKPNLAHSMLKPHQAQLLEAFNIAGWDTGIVALHTSNHDKDRMVWYPWILNRDSYFHDGKGSFYSGYPINPTVGWIDLARGLGL